MAEEEDVQVDNEEAEGDRKSVQSALHFTIGRIVESEFAEGKVTRLSVAALTELTMGYMETFAHDLENFAAHAGRRKINVEELMARRNQSVMNGISKVISELAAETELKKEQKKRKSEAGGKSSSKSKKQAHEDEILPVDDDI